MIYLALFGRRPANCKLFFKMRGLFPCEVKNALARILECLDELLNRPVAPQLQLLIRGSTNRTFPFGTKASANTKGAKCVRAGGYNRIVEEVLADLTPKGGFERREKRERCFQPIRGVRNIKGLHRDDSECLPDCPTAPGGTMESRRVNDASRKAE